MNENGKNDRNIIQNDVEIRGSINFQKKLDFAGKLFGDIKGGEDSELLILSGGYVKGDIGAAHVRIETKVDANVTGQTLSLGSTGFVNGDVKVDHIKVVERGGRISGLVTLPDEKSASPGNDQSEVAPAAEAQVPVAAS